MSRPTVGVSVALPGAHASPIQLLAVGGVVVALAAVACQASPERVPAGPGGVGPIAQDEPAPSSSPGARVGNQSPTPPADNRPPTPPVHPAPPKQPRCHTADLAVEVGRLTR